MTFLSYYHTNINFSVTIVFVLPESVFALLQVEVEGPAEVGQAACTGGSKRARSRSNYLIQGE